MMHCLEGSAWIELGFSLIGDQAQAVDQFGMTKLKTDPSYDVSNLADFLFTIAQTKDGVILQGIAGTSWRELSFTLAENVKQAIDQFGMTKLN